jgi:hypothetical protein
MQPATLAPGRLGDRTTGGTDGSVLDLNFVACAACNRDGRPEVYGVGCRYITPLRAFVLFVMRYG